MVVNSDPLINDILELVNVYQPEHGFTMVNYASIDSTMLAFERIRSFFFFFGEDLGNDFSLRDEAHTS